MVTSLEDGIPNTVYIDWNTPLTRGSEDTSPDASTGNKADNPSTKGSISDVCANAIEDVENTNQGDEEATEYFVDHIVREVVKYGETKYIARWYGYSKDKDTVEQVENIPDHFIVRFWKRRSTRHHR